MDRELVTQRLYRVFRIKDETYITTVKLLYIYDWIETSAGTSSFDVLEELRRHFKQRSNQMTMDNFYGQVKDINLFASGRYDVSTKCVPMQHDRYQSGWKVC